MLRAPTLSALICCMVLVGCAKAELYTGLSEPEANEMIAVLTSAHIDVSKTSKDGKSWTLLAGRDDFAPAVALLQSRGYPKERFTTLGDVFKRQGLISTPLEEHARLVYALSQELANTISSIDGVISARVHISIPEAEEFATSKPPSSAAVFIKYNANLDLSPQVGPVKTLVVNSVEGLTYDRVTVVLSPATEAAGAPPRSQKPAILGWIAIGLLGAAGAATTGPILLRRALRASRGVLR